MEDLSVQSDTKATEEAFPHKKVMSMFVHHLELMKSLRITRQQLEIIEYARNSGEGITAAVLSKMQGITLQNASVQLTRLAEKGYLAREKQSCKTGGHFFQYEATPIEGLSEQVSAGPRVQETETGIEMTPELPEGLTASGNDLNGRGDEEGLYEEHVYHRLETAVA